MKTLFSQPCETMCENYVRQRRDRSTIQLLRTASFITAMIWRSCEGLRNLIVTDLLFNKNRDFHATPDSLAGKWAKLQNQRRWKKSIHQE